MRNKKAKVKRKVTKKKAATQAATASVGKSATSQKDVMDKVRKGDFASLLQNDDWLDL